jgi:hypothetical protein
MLRETKNWKRKSLEEWNSNTAKNDEETDFNSKVEEYEEVDLWRTWSFVGFVK